MASPQRENGFTAISNEILDHLCYAGINGSEYRVLLFVLRKTYGYNKKNDQISLSQFQKGTLMNRANAVRTIQSLVAKRILVKDKSSYKFNKNWEEWVVAKRIPSSQTATKGSSQTDTKSSSQTDTYKRKKDNTKDNTSKLVEEVIYLFTSVDPKNKNYYGNTTQRKAADFLVAEYGLEEVSRRIGVLPKTNKMPYFPTITTPVQLRDKWVQLQDAVERKRGEIQAKKPTVI